jgi:hypothetical protein
MLVEKFNANFLQIGFFSVNLWKSFNKFPKIVDELKIEFVFQMSKHIGM